MSNVGQPERATQARVIALFRDELGYRYLGDWTDRDGTSNIEERLLSAWLAKRGYTPAQVSVALHKLRAEADNHSRSLYGNNQAVYSLLRYGVPVKIEAWGPRLSVTVNRFFVQQMKTKRVARVHRRARAGPPAPANAQRSLHRSARPLHAAVATLPRRS